MEFRIPIKLPSLLNLRVHWTRVLRMKKSQRNATRLCMHGKAIPKLPVVVTITRIGPRRLDGDNLAGACKYVRDEIARACGADDGNRSFRWRYRQRIGPYGVHVEILPLRK